MRILHLLESGGLYGAERVVLNLSDAMRAAGRFEPVIGCIVQRPGEPSALYDEARRLGFAAEKVLLRNLLLAVDVPQEARRLRGLGIDLIHSHGYKATVYGSFLRALWPVPITATCHLWFMRPGTPAKMKAMVALELRFYRRFRTVVAVSGEIRQVLVHAGVREDRVRVIPNGIPLDPPLLPAAERERLRASLGVGPEGFLVLNAGRLTAQKDQATLLRAVGGLPATGRPVTCLVAGEGELRESLQSQIVAGGWGDRVRLLGFPRRRAGAAAGGRCVRAAVARRRHADDPAGDGRRRHAHRGHAGGRYPHAGPGRRHGPGRAARRPGRAGRGAAAVARRARTGRPPGRRRPRRGASRAFQ
ncbi:MAG: glycosyltransferase [bacterium]|nr:glycosyltransferase [bacterium]